ncbi:LamG domain-containing protein [Undibacterium sp. FT147W]|uniref:LamG domain-containing protein n=1 Tax=Undibacterium rivi TaxID=2828729 RepID=A0ABS5H6Q6_9BURK|nr:LamG domain-containing protein [Undibacterium rivi]MBR7793774.1 LamG domain-containing protein [Undibacterium rivi]
MSDAFYYSTPVMLPFNGIDNSVPINYGTAASNLFSTLIGTAAVSTTLNKTGTASLKLNGGNDALTSTTGVSLPADFTVETWAYMTAYPSSYAVIAIGLPSNFGIYVKGQKVMLYFFSEYNFDVTLPLNQWFHIAMVRLSGAISLYVNGTLIGVPFSQPNAASITAIGSANGLGFIGYIDNIRISTMARYTGDFTPAPDIDIEKPVPNAKIVNAIRSENDLYFGGNGKITGTTKVKGTPDYAVHRRVRLLRDIDGRIVRETWSDPVTGAYTFNNISSAIKYTVIAYDYNHQFKAVIADNLTADVL